jgi:hypothetical protein
MMRTIGVIAKRNGYLPIRGKTLKTHHDAAASSLRPIEVTRKSMLLSRAIQ